MTYSGLQALPGPPGLAARWILPNQPHVIV